MTQEIAIRNETQVDPYQAFADDTLAAAIAGDLLTFVKGNWRRGEEKATVPPEARFLCNMEEIWTGWVRWDNKKPVEHRITRLIDRQPKLTRGELGHTDESVWETDPQGNPRDPWAETDRMVMREAGKSEELLTFSTSSVGGHYALAKLCDAYARARLNHEGQWPVVMLVSETYVHDVYGEISKPLFKVTEWASWDGSAPKEVLPYATPDDPRTQVAKELDDAIPF
jgi:hypothetical protein